MPTRIIELDDGVYVEATIEEVVDRQAIEATSGKKPASFEDVQPVLSKAIKSVANSWNKVAENVEMERATIELGLGFSTEGDAFFVKSTAEANLTVTISLTPKKAD